MLTLALNYKYITLLQIMNNLFSKSVINQPPNVIRGLVSIEFFETLALVSQCPRSAYRTGF